MIIPFPSNLDLIRFMDKIEPPTFHHDKFDCLQWKGTIENTGYGSFWMGGRRPSGKSFAVHRVSYTWFKGEIPKYRHVHHICGNQLCVKPSHLETVCQPLHRELEDALGNHRWKNRKKGH